MIERLQTTNAKYPLNRVVVRDVVVPDNRTIHILDNLFLNEPLPKRLILGFVSNNAYDGRKKHNPFKFNHHQLQHITLTKNGEIVDQYDVDFDEKRGIAPYLDLMKRVAILNTKEDLDLPFNDYIKGLHSLRFRSDQRPRCRRELLAPQDCRQSVTGTQVQNRPHLPSQSSPVCRIQ